MELNHINSVGIESVGVKSIVCVGIGHGYAGHIAYADEYAGEYAC
jgi:hypothetical protein